ncbi:hypothetical protein GGI25_006213, partial [Coemansia spiralis]
ESRVSGNTDRAECLLCQKRMLGKSADMKKHIVNNCPNRRAIAEDMLPILEIVKTELENPKKRAKRNSNTPIVMRADGSFVTVAGASSSGPTETTPVSSTRVHSASGNQPSLRTQSYHRPSPYDMQYDSQRAKMAKYSRDPMHHGGSSSSRMTESTGSGASHEHSSHFSPPMHGHQSHAPMQMAPPGHTHRHSHMHSPVNPRLQSPTQVGSYSHRHPAHPMPPMHLQPPPPPSQTQPAPSPGQASTSGSAMPQPHPSRHNSQLQNQPQPQQSVRYYPSGQSSTSHALPHQVQHSHSQRQNLLSSQPSQPLQSSSTHGDPLLQRPSQTPSPKSLLAGAQFGRFKTKLQQRIPLYGVWLSIPSPVTARMLAMQGFDWACIDMEHAPTNPALMAEMVAAVASSGTCTPIVRVPSHSPEWFKWALDAGAYGIIVPMVNTPEEMRKIEQLCKYPPLGKRSMGAFFAPHAFGLRGPRAMSDYVEQVSNDIIVIPQIESAEGVVNLPRILKAGGMDAVFVGPYDLSASIRATPDMHLQEALSHIEQATKDHDVPIGIYASSGMAAWAKMKDGYTLLVAASDIECLSSSATENLNQARGDARQYH